MLRIVGVVCFSSPRIVCFFGVARVVCIARVARFAHGPRSPPARPRLRITSSYRHTGYLANYRRVNRTGRTLTLGLPQALSEHAFNYLFAAHRLGNVLSTISEQTISVFGTFNPAAAFGLGANTAADRTARATEETAKNTRRMVSELVQGQMRFV